MDTTGIDPQQRLAQIMTAWQQYPGRAPNGTGPTGLTPNDLQGYSNMLNEQVEGLNLQRQFGGKGPTTVGMPSLAQNRLKRAVGGINNAGGVPASGPYDQTSQTT